MDKTCSHCGVAKPLEQFQRRKASTDGYTASCKQCLHERDKARYPGEREHRAKMHKIYSAGVGRDACNASKRRWRDRNAEKRAAHVILNNALRDGRIKRQPCEVCGVKKVHAHHDDYTKPLAVRWLCVKHHEEAHHG